MTTDNWTANGIGNWTTSIDWSVGTPTSGTDAFIGTNTGGIVGSGADVTVNSLGVSSAYTLDINSGSLFTLTNGTGSQEVIGAISILDASDLKIANGTFENAGTVELESAGSQTGFLFVGNVSLTGGGSITFEPGVSGSQNFFSGLGTSAELFNVNNNISGTGLIENAFFTNETGGTIETNDALGTGFMQIWGSANGGDFVNDGTVKADNGGTLQFGEAPGSIAATITNDGTIEALGTNKNTLIYIAGNVTINQSSSGKILLGGSNPGFDQIVSNGIIGDATLTINGGTVAGAGDIGDRTALVLNIGQGTVINADLPQVLTIDTGTFTITNAGTIEANTLLDIDSPVNSPNGVISIGAGGTLRLLDSALVNGNIQFNGTNATLDLDVAGDPIIGLVSGAVGGDSIDFQTVTYSPSVQIAWQQNGASGVLSLVQNGSSVASVNLTGQYTAADFSARSDLNGDTLVEVPNPNPPASTTAAMIMRDGSNGDYEIYDLGGNTIFAAYSLGQVGPEWQVAGVGAFDVPDTSDMILRNSNTGQFEIYDVSNNNITRAAGMGQVGLEWSVSGFGDFSSRSGETDMLMRDSNNGDFEVYDLANNTITSAAPMGQVGLEWSVAGFGDFSTRPNETDMLMRNSNTGSFEVYDLANNTITFAAPMGQVGLEWQIAGFGDFSGNANETDMLMRNKNTGAFEIYDISNSQLTSAAPMGQVGLEWQVAGFGPIDGVGTSDMLMRNSNTGQFEVYDISNNAITSAASMGQVGLEWAVAGIAADPPGSPPAAQLSGIAVDPAGAASNSATAQFTQAMASFAPSGGGSDASSQFAQFPAPEASNTTGLMSATNHPQATS